MSKKVIIHIAILFTCLILLSFWVTSPILSNYSLQLTALVLLTLIISRHLHQPSQFRLVESVVSTIAVILISHGTGGVNSPLFFLNYFLLFELSLLLEPIIPIFLGIGLILFYFYTHQVGTSLTSLIILLAFPFMTPLACFIGLFFRKVRSQKKEIRHLAEKVEQLKEELVEDEIKLQMTKV